MRSDRPAARGHSDADLLVHWLAEANDGAGAASLAVFMRYRALVTTELERVGGLSPMDAVRRVATVFHRARAPRADLVGLSLRDRLVAVAREVADNPPANEPQQLET